MNNWEATRLSDTKLKEFFARFFPVGFAGADVIQEIAPEQWENSPLFACFHPSPQQVLEQRLQRHRRIQELGRPRRRNIPEFLKPVQSPDMVRSISLQLDELELIFRAMEVLESKQAMRFWFNNVVPALGARPIDLCRTAQGRQVVLQELGRIEHGVHS